MEWEPFSLEQFLPPVAAWFRRALGEPTQVQRQGWPSIARGHNTLMLAPTGSGKTLAAFLACLDGLWRLEKISGGVQVLYISPLKALNNDIYRNLQVPLEGVVRTAQEMGYSLPCLTSAVRTGDTTAAERQRLLRHPPHILITTPESLHLLLTSRARDTLRNVTHCIVDEIHALCPNKRGVFLALLLERLEEINPRSFVRIGLSATQRPLEEVARFLGGAPSAKPETVGQAARLPSGQASEPLALRTLFRPVTIVDAGLRKNLDLRVLSPVEQFGAIPEKTVWPSIYRLLTDLVQSHRSTIIFTNNRRSAERITAQLNEILGEENVERGEGSVKSGATIKAHHGSVSLEVRQETEQALKEGRLAAVVATASLELGIDMGTVDLVCQVESPGEVSRGLQRVGRAGHLVGQESKGRLIPKTLSDLLDQAVLAAEMAAGRVEEIRVPSLCLDVLAQQIVAMVAMESWDVEKLFQVIRRAYPYRDLTPQVFESVLEMVSGRFASQNPSCQTTHPLPTTHSQMMALQPRISWDRVHNRLLALPGSQRLALTGGGTIPDTGQYAVYTLQGLRVGELDEEFIYERRLGDVFFLGTHTWRIEKIEADRVLVSPGEGSAAMVPFWRGEKGGRSYDLGLAQGRFLRTLSRRIDAPDCFSWLQHEHFLDPDAARNLCRYVRRQIDRTGLLPTDQTFVTEVSRDPLGDWQIIFLCPLGNRLNLTLRLALENLLRRRLGYRPQCLHHDDGILIRLADSPEPVLDILDGLTPDNARNLVLEELADSALFALRFRQNAARALLLSRHQVGKRAPLWLQRWRGRDLLQVARQFPDFPLVAETLRECLHDHLDVPHLEALLADLQQGQVEVRQCRLEAPSPFAAGLLFAFTAAGMYQYDDVEPEPGKTFAGLDQELLGHLLPGRDLTLDPRAVEMVQKRLRGLGRPPRNPVEMAEWLRRLGDLAPSDLEGPMADFLKALQCEGRVEEMVLPQVSEKRRWILTEEKELYQSVFGSELVESERREQAGAAILYRFLETHALVSLQDILDRYPFEREWARRKLEDWAEKGRLVPIPRAEAPEPLQWSAPENYEQIQRGTLAVLRREVLTCPASQFADFLLHWQFLHPQDRKEGPGGLSEIIHRLQALYLPAELWEQTVLSSRMTQYHSGWLEDALGSGQWTWACHGSGQDEGQKNLAFLNRENLKEIPPPGLETTRVDGNAEIVLECLRQHGALFVSDLAQILRLSPSHVRSSLGSLLEMGLVTNDRFEVIRRGDQDWSVPSAEEGPSRMELRRPPRPGYSTRPGRSPRSPLQVHEGRWSLLSWSRPETETQAVFFARILLERYGIVSRELASLDPQTPPWRVLYEVLSRLEWAGEVRRGYFVEGLSGAQFALPGAARMLRDLSLPAQAHAPVILIHSLDPANIHGSGAPLEILRPDGESKTFYRRLGNWLVVRAGKPLLLIEQQGRRLTSLPQVEKEHLAQAVACLSRILDRNRGSRNRLVVEEWNGEPVTASPGKELLEDAGFVRDYQAMTLYSSV